MANIKGQRITLIFILLIAFLIRFWGAGNYDLFGDEAIDAFRGIGYIDFLGTSFQTQPIDWYKNTTLPWWTKLSFHDFPPMAMIIQHIFFSIFGDSILVARLPAITLGTVSVYLMYLIVKRLFNNANLALFAAFLTAINSVMIWIFRTSLLEPILIFFILLNIYWFFKFNENIKYWWIFGITFGFVALTKYTGVFLLPIYIVYLLIMNRKLLASAQFYAALGIALLLFSPVIIYNYYLYETTGHLDLQVAYLLGQETPEWTALIGKVQAPFSEIWKNFISRWDFESNTFYPVASYQIPFLLTVLGGFFYSVFWFGRSNKAEKEGLLFFWLYFIFYTLLLIKIGSAHRFLAVYGPPFMFFAALAIWRLWEWRISSKIFSYFIKVIIILFFIWEIFYSVDKNFFKMPDYGMTQLDHYFEEEFKGKKSAVIPTSDNPHLNKIIQKFVLKNRNFKGERSKMLIVFNDNVALPTLSWVFYRRFFYQSIPTLFIENFYKAISVEGKDYFKDFDIYFVQSTQHTLLNKMKLDKTIGREFENQLLEKGLFPEKIIYGSNNLSMFKIYKFRI